VLEGAKSVLNSVRDIKVEAADFEAYGGGTTVETLTGFGAVEL
jgi:hypothetical protein